MSGAAGASRPSRTVWREALLCYGGVAATLYAYRLLAGHDLNFDARNYHLYAPYAFLTGTTFRHIAPGRVQSYINPLGLLPFYWAVTALPPRAATAALVATEALNAVPVYLLCRFLAAPFLARPWTLAAPMTFVGMTSAAILSQAGTSFTDLDVAIPVSVALLLLARAVADAVAPGARTRRLVIGGLLLGVAVALKLSQGILVASMMLALLACTSLRPILVAGISALAGWVLCGAWWEYAVAAELGEPLAIVRAADPRFLPRGVVDVLLFPWWYALGSGASGEVPLRDPRWLVTIALGVAGGLATLWRGQRPRLRGSAGAFVLLFLLIGYLAWRLGSSLQRFAVSIDLAIPAALVVIICWTWRSARARVAVGAAVVVLSLLTTRPGNWGTTPWRETWFPMRLPKLLDVPNAVILMTGVADVQGFVVPSFPPTAHAHLVGDATYVSMPRLAARLRDDIDHGWPNVFVFGIERDRAAELEALRRFGVEATTECERGWIVASDPALAEVYACRLRPLPG